MKILLLLLFVYTQTIFATDYSDTDAILKGGLSKISYRENIKSCYRWMSNREKLKWMKGKAVLAHYPTDGLGRAGRDNARATFCWSNPVTAHMGGTGEFYGDVLMRIDLVDDVVVYDRNLHRYFQNGKEMTSAHELQRGVSTEFMYGNYVIDGEKVWFQEYVIRSAKAIEGWTFNDQALKENFNTELERLNNQTIPLSEYHYFAYSRTYQSRFFETSGHPYYLSRLLRANEILQNEWQNSGEYYFVNPESR